MLPVTWFPMHGQLARLSNLRRLNRSMNPWYCRTWMTSRSSRALSTSTVAGFGRTRLVRNGHRHWTESNHYPPMTPQLLPRRHRTLRRSMATIHRHLRSLAPIPRMKSRMPHLVLLPLSRWLERLPWMRLQQRLSAPLLQQSDGVGSLTARMSRTSSRDPLPILRSQKNAFQGGGRWQQTSRLSGARACPASVTTQNPDETRPYLPMTRATKASSCPRILQHAALHHSIPALPRLALLQCPRLMAVMFPTTHRTRRWRAIGRRAPLHLAAHPVRRRRAPARSSKLLNRVRAISRR